MPGEARRGSTRPAAEQLSAAARSWEAMLTGSSAVRKGVLTLREVGTALPAGGWGSVSVEVAVVEVNSPLSFSVVWPRVAPTSHRIIPNWSGQQSSNP